MCIRFRCCVCGHKVKAALDWAGRRARCPSCASTNLVPKLGVIGLARKTRPLRPPIKHPDSPGGIAVSPPATSAATAAPASPAPITVTSVALAPFRVFAQDRHFWLHLGGGMVAGVLLLTLLALLLPGCTPSAAPSRTAASSAERVHK